MTIIEISYSDLIDFVLGSHWTHHCWRRASGTWSWGSSKPWWSSLGQVYWSPAFSCWWALWLAFWLVVSSDKQVQRIQVWVSGWPVLYLNEGHCHHPGTKLSNQVLHHLDGSVHLSPILLPPHVIQSTTIHLLQARNTFYGVNDLAVVLPELCRPKKTLCT